MRRIAPLIALAATAALQPASGLAVQAPSPPPRQVGYDHAHLKVVERFRGSVPLADGRSVQVVVADWSLESQDYVSLPITQHSVVQVRAGGLALEVNGKRTVLRPNDALAIPGDAHVRVRPVREASIFTVIGSHVP